MKSSEDEKTENCGVGGEGDSSRAHGIPNGTGNNQLSIKKRGDGTVASLYVVGFRLSEEFAEGFFDLADGVEGDMVFLAVEALEVVLGDDDVCKA